MGIIARVLGIRGILSGLNESCVDPDPVVQFRQWFDFAKGCFVYMPNACALATATEDGRPSVRMVLLKSVDASGFVFFTNYLSRKGWELDQNPYASLLFHWVDLHRQVRVEGKVERVTHGESERYFKTRPRGSRIGAWASRQSSVLEKREELESRVSEFERKYPGDVPLPDHWGGYRLVPKRIEFWQARPNRLHDRLVYEREGDAWKVIRLAP